ncbi:MAG: sialate O-acetylesterase [Pontixanthobacter sp.]
MNVAQRRRRMRTFATIEHLAGLVLSPAIISETASVGAVVGSVKNMRTDSQLSLIDDAEGRFTLTNNAIELAVSSLDYEEAPSHRIVVRERNPAFTPQTRDTTINIEVANAFEQPDLRSLTLSVAKITRGEAVAISVQGTTSGSDVTGVVPDGLTLNGATRIIEGTPETSGEYRFSLVETLGDSANSPRATDIVIEVVEATPADERPKVVLAVIAGQSNSVGRNLTTGDPNASATNPADPNPELNDTDPDIFQFVGNPSQADHRTLTNDIVYLDHFEDALRIGPGLPILYGAKAQNPEAKVVAVPCGRGSSGILNGSWLSAADDGAGGLSFENMMNQVRGAIAEIRDRWPNAVIIPQIYWVQGEQDAAERRSYSDYKTALADIIDRTRSRLADAIGEISDYTTIPWIIGSMVPRKFIDTGSGYSIDYVPINRAHVDLSLEMSNVRYVLGPDNRVPATNAADLSIPAGAGQDNLHYQPHSFAREQGRRLVVALADNMGPQVTNRRVQGSEMGTKLAVPLGHDDVFGHATFHIDGGADAHLFEISDPYTTPHLRWRGDSTGPNSAGSFEVAISARDGAGNMGPSTMLTVKVALPYGEGDQGPITVASTYAEEDYNAPFGGMVRTMPLRKGLNLFAFHAASGGNRDSSFAVTVDGAAASKLIGNAVGNNLQIWSFISAVAKDASIAVTYSGTGGNYMIAAAALTGSKAQPMATAFKPWSNQHGRDPYTASALTVPEDGILICLAATNIGPLEGRGDAVRSGLSSPTGRAALFTQATSGAIQFRAGSFSGSASLVFERSK